MRATVCGGAPLRPSGKGFTLSLCYQFWVWRRGAGRETTRPPLLGGPARSRRTLPTSRQGRAFSLTFPAPALDERRRPGFYSKVLSSPRRTPSPPAEAPGQDGPREDLRRPRKSSGCHDRGRGANPYRNLFRPAGPGGGRPRRHTPAGPVR